MTELFNREGIQFVKNLMRESYHEKRLAFENFLKNKKNISLEEFVRETFGTKYFNGSDISKADFIVQLLNDEIRLDYWIFLRGIFRNLGYLNDRRHTEEYAFDIALGWLSEELIVNEIKDQIEKFLGKNENYEIGFMGIDADREYQSLNIKAKADFYINIDQRSKEKLYEDYKNETGDEAIYRNLETNDFKKWKEKNLHIKIDLFVDYKGTWRKNEYFDFKKGKIDHFKKKELDWVLAFDVVNQDLYLISREETLGYELTPNPAMGNVKTAKIPLSTPIELSEIFKIIKTKENEN